MEKKVEIMDIIKNILPSGAQILKVKDYYDIPAIIVSDIDGDGTAEICVGYKVNNGIYVSILKYENNKWNKVATIKGEGIGISDMLSVAAEKPGVNNLVIGWKLSNSWSILRIYKLVKDDVVNILDEDIYYSKIEVEDMEDKGRRNGVYEFAVWKKDGPGTYDIKVYRLKNGRFEVAKDVYKGYFKGVINYYLGLIETEGVNPLYLYHLADSEAKAGRINDAINTLNVLLQSNNPYPSRNAVIALKENYEKQLYK